MANDQPDAEGRQTQGGSDGPADGKRAGAPVPPGAKDISPEPAKRIVPQEHHHRHDVDVAPSREEDEEEEE